MTSTGRGSKMVHGENWYDEEAVVGVLLVESGMYS